MKTKYAALIKKAEKHLKTSDEFMSLEKIYEDGVEIGVRLTFHEKGGSDIADLYKR